MTASTVQLRLQIVGQDALQQMQRLNLQQQQAQQRQTQGASQILRIQHQVNSSVQQASRYSQQQLRTNQSQVQTNRILTQMLQQQHRHTSLITQQLRQQQRDYQLQLNTLRQQVAASDRLRQNLQQAGLLSMLLSYYVCHRTALLPEDTADSSPQHLFDLHC